MDAEKWYIDKIQDGLKKLNTASAKSMTFAPSLVSLGKEIWKDVSTVKVDKEDTYHCSVKRKFFKERWSVCDKFLFSEDEKMNLMTDSKKRKELRTKLQQKLRGITIRASVSENAQGTSQQFQGSVRVEHGTVVAIYESLDGWVGFILCKSRVLEFRGQHFESDLPLPLQCDDKVSFLVPTNNLSSVLPGSIRVTEYHSEIGPGAVNVAESFLQKANSDIILHNKQASALLAKLLSESDALQNPQFIEGVLMLAVSFIVIRFPIGSEEERDTNYVFVPFGLNKSGYVNPMEQKRFLSFFKGSAYPNHLVQFCKEKVHSSEKEIVDTLVKAIFLLIALLKEFPEEVVGGNLADHAKSMSKELAPFMDNEVVVKLLSLIISVISASPSMESWRSIPALLTVEEFHRRVHEGMPPVAEVKATYRDLEEYFDTYYKLLREDAYRGICRSVRRYLELDEEKLSQKNDAIYQIRFLEVVPYGMGRFNLCRVEWEPKTEAVKQEGGENSLYLHEGNLFCISASGKFDPEKTGDVLFAVKVSEHSSMRAQGCSRGILLKFLSADCNGISEVEAIEKLQVARHDDKAVMVESPVFYRAYEPVLTALKAMDTQHFPFKSEVLNLQACRLDDAYLPRVEKAVDIGPFQSVDIKSAKCKMCHASEVHEELKATSILNETQVQAVDLVLNQRLAIIEGPPGTGKTFLTSRIIQSLLDVQKPQTPIVVMAYKNRVLDQLVSKCTTFCGEDEIIRLGRLSEDYQQDKKLQTCLMSQKWFPKGPADLSVHHLHKSVAGMWKDWKESLMLKPEQFTLSSCLELVKQEAVQEFFSDLDVQELMQDLDGPLRPQAEAIFEERKRQWLHSQHQEGVQKNTTKYSGNGEAEDEHKEMDRICDTEDALIICSSEDEEFEEGPIGETALEMNGEFGKEFKEGTDADSAQYLKDKKFFKDLNKKQYQRAKTRLQDALNRIEEVTQEAEGQRLDAKLKLLKKAKVVAMTTTKACIDHKLLHRLQPEMIVIEEAGGILESNVIACLTPKTKHLVMVGDYKQIGPMVVSQELKIKKDKHLKNFSASLMERLVDPNSVETGQAMPKFPFVCLDTQSRMNPALLPLFEQDYAGGDRPIQRSSLQTRREILPSVAHPQCMQFPFFWWSYPKAFGHERSVNGKICNELEAKMAASYCYWLYSEGFTPDNVAILSPYRAQVNKIKEELCNCHRRMAEFAQLSVFTVDEFQGHERELVVLSLVRNNKKRNVGFLMDRTRQVVAVSRQKRALCIIGCHDHFMDTSPSWKKRIEAFSAHVSEHLLIRRKKVQSPEEVTKLVRERLAQSGRCQQPLYDRQPILPEDKCHANVEDHAKEPTHSQMPTVGEHSTGNVINLCIQNVVGDVRVPLVQRQSAAEVEDQPDGGSKEKLLKKWKGQKLVRGCAWDRLKTSLCLIDCPDWTGTGCIGKKDDKLYLITCWHNFEENASDSAKAILKLARESTVQFSYTDETARPEWRLKGSTLLQNKMPVRCKDLDLVALPVKEEVLRRLPAQIYPVDLSAVRYIKNREGQPEQLWKDYYITIVGFPGRDDGTGADPLTVSIGKVKGEKDMRNPYLLYHDADTKPGSSGSPVIVAERLQTPDGPINGLAVIALHTEEAKKQSNIATLLTPLIDKL